VLLEVQRLFKDVGLLVRGATVTWARNDAEKAAMQRSASDREQELLDYQLACKKRELQRNQDITTFQLRSDVDVEKLKAASEDELRHLVLQQELGFVDARQAGVRAQELKTLDHELQLLTVRRKAGYQQALDDAQNEFERAEIRRKMTMLDLDLHAVQEEQRLRLTRQQEEQALALAAAARRQQMDSLREMSAIELDGKERDRRIDREDRLTDAEMKLRASQQASLTELEKLKLQAQMTPDQILAIGAGLSPDVARIFAERAKVMSIDVEKREALLREMVQLSTQGRMATEEQARFFFDKAMQATSTAVGVVTSRPPAAPAGPAPTETVECPGCHRRPPVTDRFCRYCGHALVG